MQDLTRVALIGTAHAGAVAPLNPDFPAERLLTKLGTELDREHLFLLRAGANAVFDLCAQAAPVDERVVSVCPPEQRAVAPPQAVSVLQSALANSAWDLIQEAFQQLAERDRLWPHELLPQLFALTDVELRQCALPVLGERARWLSQFNPTWQWVTAGVTSLSAGDRPVLLRVWEEGSIADRCRALESLRRFDAAEGRQWLAAALPQEKAEYRARLVAVLQTGLQADDEPLLESLLDDRSEHVRQTAAGLLARIPGSALSRRMSARTLTLLTADRVGLLRRKLKLVCHPPEEIDKDWERDGFPRKVSSGQGKRAIWTTTLLSTVDPDEWSTRFSAEPATLIAAVGGDDFENAVLTGWTQAALSFSSTTWLQALWEHWLGVESRTRDSKSPRPVLGVLQEIIKVLPDAEAALRPVLHSGRQGACPDLLLLLQSVPRPWSAALGRDYLSSLRTVLSHDASLVGYQWANSLATAARALPPALFAAALEPFALAVPDSSWHSGAIGREIDKFAAAIQARKSFYESLGE